jgi:hypothetical protein
VAEGELGDMGLTEHPAPPRAEIARIIAGPRQSG